ncbi:MAG TPA: phosphoglycerate kinase [Candidatus Latescibacteria bacterium]|nr:phosphoglycerate kinase [Candidatus Latescibacterota bacterium]
MAKLGVSDLGLKGKHVLMRVDFNVPLDDNGEITDDTRIKEALRTIRYIIEAGGKLVLMSHLGRPKGRVVPALSLAPVAERLSQLLGQPVRLAPDCVGPEVERLVAHMRDGDVILLENLRFHPEEEKNDPDFARSLSRLGEIYVNDAFGTAHRAHASTVGVASFFDQRAAGFLIQKEIRYLGEALANPRRPFVAIIGGAKISGKIEVINNLLDRVDTLLIGGGMSYTFFKSQGLEIGKSIFEVDKVELAKQILQKADATGVELLLPVDCVIADQFSGDAATKVVDREGILPDWQAMDIGPKTIGLFEGKIEGAETIFWNGPVGVFEFDRFAVGTNAIAHALTKATQRGAVTIVGGGDSAAAIVKAGLKDKISHISTGGGASLEYLEGKPLPGIAVLNEKG